MYFWSLVCFFSSIIFLSFLSITSFSLWIIVLLNSWFLKFFCSKKHTQGICLVFLRLYFFSFFFWLYPLSASLLPLLLPPLFCPSLFLFISYVSVFAWLPYHFFWSWSSLHNSAHFLDNIMYYTWILPKFLIYLRLICLSDLQSEDWILFSMYSCYFDVLGHEVEGVSTGKKMHNL